MEPLRLKADDLLVVLTGAGVSAESGIKTFRDNDGLWESYRIEDVATLEAFERNPDLVLRFYDQRRRQLKEVGPTPAHVALADLEKQLGAERFLLITQNVDDLHERAGSRNVLHMHGELKKVRCLRCSTIVAWGGDLLNEAGDGFARCRCGGVMRPHIVWFGEMPFEMERIHNALFCCSHFLAVGTSGVVYPAAGFIQLAKSAKAKTYGINLEPPENRALFDHFYQGKAGDLLPLLLRSIEE